VRTILLGISGRAKSLVLLSLLLSLSFTTVASAITTISQGYLTKDQLPLGSLVSLDKNTSDHVEIATIDNVNRLLGVVIDPGNSLLSVSTSKDAQVQVATSGVVQVLVSDINGSIVGGDSLTASPISGVAMKATVNSKVIGTAQDALGNNNGSRQTYKDKSGKQHTALIGTVPVLVNVSYFFKQPDKTVIPQALQNVANSLAGKSVKPLPIIISAAIFIITLIVVTIIIYSMIRSSIISVGRNPMSQAAVYRDLVQMSALVLTILAVSFMAIYLILKKF
jgi:hypothetical protein